MSTSPRISFETIKSCTYFTLFSKREHKKTPLIKVVLVHTEIVSIKAANEYDFQTWSKGTNFREVQYTLKAISTEARVSLLSTANG